ncbi:A24 family peptidase [Paraburkholderia tagetis]|uniref:Prepilin peptidase n=1 Tax=Paraburkholderia tagetis TaxID=2913261 RepID=A0A9X1RRK4_9BURK|nr:prepilin peptidase [Paraburkholderia tagetis]MCG5073938.1 prepilin peptidase [Paraburkholderia tagetis]
MIPFYLSSLVFGAWAVAVAVCDCRSRRVPNALVGAGFVAALTAALLHAGPAHLGIGQALAAAAVGLAALMPFFVLGMMGAADVKVFAVLGAWCGMQPLVGLWVVASLAAFVHALAMLITLRARAHVAMARPARPARLVTEGAQRGTPYAACLSVPALVWLALQLMSGWP